MTGVHKMTQCSHPGGEFLFCSSPDFLCVSSLLPLPPLLPPPRPADLSEQNGPSVSQGLDLGDVFRTWDQRGTEGLSGQIRLQECMRTICGAEKEFLLDSLFLF